MDSPFRWHSHSGSIGSYGVGRVHSSHLPQGLVPIAGTTQPEVPIGAFGSHIVRLSYPRHNEFAITAGPSEIISKGSGGSFLAIQRPRLLPRNRFLTIGVPPIRCWHA